jgi:uncharacterized protein YegL
VSKVKKRWFPRNILLSLMVLSLLHRIDQAEADCACAGGELEIAFVLDCSGSMNHTLGTLQEQIKRMVEALQGQVRQLRAAVVCYRTKEYAGRQKKIQVFAFTSDGKELAEFLRGQTAEGGGEELVEEALDAAVKELRWTRGARKVAILLGDEQPSEEKQSKCVAQARALKERGITLHTVTASQTAWIYWIPNQNASWKQQLQCMSEEEKKIFRLPHFDELASTAGGISVSSWNSKELVLWLLAFGLGVDAKDAKEKVDVDKYLEWAKQRDLAEAQNGGSVSLSAGQDESSAGPPLIAWIKHGGDWQVPHHFQGLWSRLEPRLALSGSPSVRLANLTDAELYRFPVLYVTGHGPVKWSYTEREILKTHVSNGGFLFADACCGDEKFTASMREILQQIFPDRPLEKLDPAHPIYSCGYRIEQVRRSAEPRSNNLRSVDPELFGLTIDDGTGKARLAVVLSPHDLGCAWHSRPLGLPCQHHDTDGLLLSANVLVWALTR